MTNLGNERKDFHIAGSHVKTLRRPEDEYFVLPILRYLPVERGTLSSWSAVGEGSPVRRMNLRKEIASDVL